MQNDEESEKCAFVFGFILILHFASFKWPDFKWPGCESPVCAFLCFGRGVEMAVWLTWVGGCRVCAPSCGQKGTALFNIRGA